MKTEKIKTFGDLKKAGYKSKSIKEELRQNLLEKIRNGESVFEGIHGYENTVIPQLERAILSKHNINFLGLRGQAKTRLARLMVKILDPWIPVVRDSEINDDPFQPVSRLAKDKIKEMGDETPISWVPREDRFFEKLATPDVSIADLIGDIDPIKASNLRLNYADDRVIHFGMIPRANRSIFVINELPDLQARIQVALFNILQEGDVQIRGFKLRLPLDLQFVFTANPEDYTNRGSIVTPLKDRIGSQILTHYPGSIGIAKTITRQEAKLNQQQMEMVHVPELAMDLIEQIGFEARENEYIDAKSGISARLSISAYENLYSTAERRAIKTGEERTTVRMGDFLGVIPAITGKIELVYEGEQEGSDTVALLLIGNAIKTLFPRYFPKIEKIEKTDTKGPYNELLEWFFAENEFQLLDEVHDKDYQKILEMVGPLNDLIVKYQPDFPEEDRYFLKEFVLWGLVEFKKLSKQRLSQGMEFKDLYGSYISRLQ
ncbi:MAG TPA: magnesium chelatase [Salinimicrobium sp.]|nr:magnesium chelatase [Salinimicrobium sp.]